MTPTFLFASPLSLPLFQNASTLRHCHRRGRRRLTTASLPLDVLSVAPGTPVQPPASVVIGSVALAIPFFVAAVLFGERILRQRSCEKCQGSGLVENNRGQLKRCAGCGGFLPWQSWRRFFTG